MEGTETPGSTELCAIHPDRVAVGTCDRCGNFYCGDCRGPDGALCINCNQVRSYIPWEDDSLGLWDRYWFTIKRSIVEYQLFARELPVEGGLGRPLMYAMIPSMLSSLIIALAAAGMADMFIVPSMGADTGALGQNPIIVLAIAFMFYFVGGAVGYVVYTFGWALVLFISSRLFGAPKLTYEGLFRILCYSSGLNLLSFVPLVGMLVFLYHAVITTLCVVVKADVGTGRGLAVVLAPLGGFIVFCCGGYVLVLAATLGMGGSP